MSTQSSSNHRPVVVIPPIPPDVHRALVDAGYEIVAGTPERVDYRHHGHAGGHDPGPAAPAVGPGEPLLFTPSAAAGILGVSRSTLYLLLAEGRIQSVKIGSLRRISRAALEQYVSGLSHAAAR